MRRGVLGLWFVVCGLNLLAMSLSVQQLHIFAEDSSYEIAPRITQILIRVVWALIFSLVVQQHHLAPDHRIRSLSVESDTIRTSCFTSGGGGCRAVLL